MSDFDLVSAAKRHDLQNADVALIAGVQRRAVQNWINGQQQTPHALQLLFYALDEHKISMEWIASKVKPKDEKVACQLNSDMPVS